MFKTIRVILLLINPKASKQKFSIWLEFGENSLLGISGTSTLHVCVSVCVLERTQNISAKCNTVKCFLNLRVVAYEEM